MIQIRISPGYITKFTATLEDWDLGIPLGDGDTIQEAIENFLEAWEMKYDETPNYQWI